MRGEEIFHARDALGPVIVNQHGDQRILHFGNGVEQSIVSLSRPAHLIWGYTQAMMLGLLFVKPRRAAILGLGGGSLARALYASCPDCRIDGVELRPLVVQAARQHLLLPDDRRLRVHDTDATSYLQRAERLDLLLADIYEADGMHADQGEPQFLLACRGALTPDGVAVFNLWNTDLQLIRRIRQQMDDCFDGQWLELSVQEGNRIVLGFARSLPRVDRRELMLRADKLARQLDIPLCRHVRRLWSDSGERLAAAD